MSNRRSGFTVLELMVVVMVIAILVALIFPAVNSAIARARDAQVVTEIAGLRHAALEFRSTHGEFPPSYIEIDESGFWSTPRQRESLRVLQKVFGREFEGPTWDPIAKLWIAGPKRDVNHDGDTSDVIVLDGPECLVFFLGGVPSQSASGGFVLHGLSPNKTNPFAFAPGARNRVKFFEKWDASRLHDHDGDGFPDYHDLFSERYAFFSTTATGAYRNSPDGGDTGLSHYWMSDVNHPWAPGSMQIISAGRDGRFGPGGSYGDGSRLFGARDVERDNITTFANGRLAR